MSVSVHRRPVAALVVAVLLTAGLAAPASASPWSDAWSRFAGWFSGSPFGALWAADEATPPAGDDGETGQTTRGTPMQVLGNEGAFVDPNGRPAGLLSGGGPLVDPNGAPRP